MLFFDVRELHREDVTALMQEVTINNQGDSEAALVPRLHARLQLLKNLKPHALNNDCRIQVRAAGNKILSRGTAVKHDRKELVAEQFAQLPGELCQR